MKKLVSDSERKKIQKFDIQVASYESYMNDIMIGILSFILIITAIFPYNSAIVVFIGIGSSLGTIIGSRYFFIKDRHNKKGANLYHITRYAPVSKKAYLYIRTEYILKWFAKVLIATLLLKTLIVILSNDTFSLGSYASIILLCFVYPVGTTIYTFVSALNH